MVFVFVWSILLLGGADSYLDGPIRSDADPPILGYGRVLHSARSDVSETDDLAGFLNLDFPVDISVVGVLSGDVPAEAEESALHLEDVGVFPRRVSCHLSRDIHDLALFLFGLGLGDRRWGSLGCGGWRGNRGGRCRELGGHREVTLQVFGIDVCLLVDHVGDRHDCGHYGESLN